MTRRFLAALCVLMAVSPVPAQERTGRVLAQPMPPVAGKDLPTPALEAASPSAARFGADSRDRAYGALQRGFYLTALRLALPLAKLGDSDAQTLAGEIYARGLGVPRSDAEAARWYESAARSGNPDGQFRFAVMLLDGSAGRTDVAEAQKLMRSAADAGIALAQYNYAQMLIETSPASGFADAVAYFSRAADAGVADAQYAMAQLYAYGQGVAAPDLAKARAYLAEAAASGNVVAQIELGIWTINGKGGPKDATAGANWLRRAAAHGNPIAMNRLAHLYKDGIGVAADKVAAAKWSVLAKRAANTDPVLDEFFRSLDDATTRTALEEANRFRAG